MTEKEYRNCPKVFRSARMCQSKIQTQVCSVQTTSSKMQNNKIRVKASGHGITKKGKFHSDEEASIGSAKGKDEPDVLKQRHEGVKVSRELLHIDWCAPERTMAHGDELREGAGVRS